MGQAVRVVVDKIEEFKERLADPWWRLTHLYYITDAYGQKQLFQPNMEQRELLGSMWYLNLILKARQLGMTTFIQIFILDRCLFNDDVRAGVIAHNQEDARTFFRDKIKFAYDNLPEWLRAHIGLKKASERELQFTNNSSIRVGTSMRSGTIQYLHISEFGKICAMYPQKAKEIVTGTLPAVHAGSFCFIESTAEGQEGYFYDFCQEAQNHALEGRELTTLDYRFHFFPWWEHEPYQLDPKGVIIPERMKRYFTALLEKEGIKLTKAQKAWYVKTESKLGEDMKREHPSTPEEAFAASVEGAYFQSQMAKIRERGQICHVPFEPQFPVHTFWDLGKHDSTAIWFMQWIHNQARFIRYYELNNEPIQFYLRKLQEFSLEHEYVYGKMFLPHDSAVADYSRADKLTRAEIVEAAGYDVVKVDRPLVKMESIQAARDALPNCWLDEEGCADGIKCLDNYRKKWDENNGRWMDEPMKNFAVHGADAFQTYALGFYDSDETLGYYDP